MQIYEKGQKPRSSHYGTDMSKTQIFPVSIVNAKNGKINTYVAFNKMQIFSAKRIQLEPFQYFEDMIINFEHVNK